MDAVDTLIAAGRTVSARGWTPATSGNLSVRAEPGFLVTASGPDKGALTRDDILHVDPRGVPMGTTRRPSAETALHAALYTRDTTIGAVVHVHSMNATVLSLVSPTVALEGFELQKAFAGVRTHGARVVVPVIDNDQDVARLAAAVGPLLDEQGCGPGYLIRGHGLYCWGATMPDALRHAEAFDFLFGCVLALRRVP